MSRLIKAQDVRYERPRYSSWARAAGDVLEQNPICRDNMREILLQWEDQLKLVVLRENGEWRKLGDIFEDLSIFAKHEHIFKGME